jgi:catechol 2,3-dioxygenase-like lactoylglutathione lyase family enzyme
LIDASTHVRIARPSRDLAAAERFYVTGLGLHVLWRMDGGADEHDLLMLGLPDAGWHLELVGGPNVTTPPQPTEDDLLVLYLSGPVDDTLIAGLVAAGGRRVSQTAYWDRWGVTVEDPDGYRLVLCTRSWSNG